MARARYAQKRAERGGGAPARTPEQKARHAAGMRAAYHRRREVGRCGACGGERDGRARAAGWADCSVCHARHRERQAARRARLRRATWRGADRDGRPLPTGRAVRPAVGGVCRLHVRLDVPTREVLKTLLRRDAERQRVRQERFGAGPPELEYRVGRIVRGCIAEFAERTCPPPKGRKRTLCCGEVVSVWVDARLRAAVEREAARYHGGCLAATVRCMILACRPLVVSVGPRRRAGW